jgi:hypothetical protein
MDGVLDDNMLFDQVHIQTLSLQTNIMHALYRMIPL